GVEVAGAPRHRPRYRARPRGARAGDFRRRPAAPRAGQCQRRRRTRVPDPADGVRRRQRDTRGAQTGAVPRGVERRHRSGLPGVRLLMALREVEFSPTDELLRDDVRRLGAMVGGMLAEQVSPEFLELVETVRKAAIARREDDAPVSVLAARLAEVPAADVDLLVRAFAAYFGATNLAERVHRIRRRRDHQRDGDAPQPGGLEAVLGELRDAGVTLDELRALLPRLSIEPVFTAHPTEVVRRALLDKEHTIVERLVADIDRGRTPDERRAGDAPQPGGLEAVLGELRDAGVTLDELRALLPRLSIEPVFTAHPTEVVRRALLDKEHTIVERLVADIDRGRTPDERRADEAR